MSKLKVGQKSKTHKCPNCKKPLRYRGEDANGKQVFNCKRPFRVITPAAEPETIVEQVFGSKNVDDIKVGYCNYEIRV